MTSKRFTDEFKAEAVRQVSERGYPATEVAERLGVLSHSLYAWLRERGVSRDARKAQKEVDLVQENARLRVDVPPLLSSTAVWSPIPHPKEIA